MLNPKLATRYAKSLVDLAQEKNKLEDIYKDMSLIFNACKGSAELVNVLKSPVIKADKKEKILDALFSNHIGEITSLYIRLLVRKGRENILDEIASAFIDQYRVIRKIYSVKLTTAIPISDKVKEYLVDKIKRSIKDAEMVEVQTSVNDALIGGFVMEVNNNLIDASISKDLKEVRRQFSSNEYIYNIR